MTSRAGGKNLLGRGEQLVVALAGPVHTGHPSTPGLFDYARSSACARTARSGIPIAIQTLVIILLVGPPVPITRSALSLLEPTGTVLEGAEVAIR
jgi:hypothetical protein